MAKKSNNTQEAAHGERMIEVKLRFWTNGLAGKAGEIVPKHAWAAGVVRMEPNKSHGIVSMHPKPFHSLMDVGAVIENVLIEHGLMLHPSRKMQKYIEIDADDERREFE